MSEYNYSYINDGSILSVDKGKEAETGVVCVGYTSEYVYIVYNPNKEHGGSAACQIQVIDWQGNPVKLLYSPKEISYLFIDEKDKKGYVIVQDPNDELMYFNP